MPEITQEQINEGIKNLYEENPEILEKTAEDAAKQAAKKAPWDEIRAELKHITQDEAEADEIVEKMKSSDKTFKDLDKDGQLEHMKSMLRGIGQGRSFRENKARHPYFGDKNKNIERLQRGEDTTTAGEKILGAWANELYKSGLTDRTHKNVARTLRNKGFNDAADRVEKSMEAGDFSAGGSTVPLEVAEQIIAYNFPANVIEDFNITRWPLDSGSFDIPKFTNQVQLNWEGESSAASTTEAETGRRSLEAKKLIALVPVSNDLLQRAIDGFEQQLMQHVRKAAQLARQIAFLRGDGQNKPLGILNSVASENRFDRLGSAGGTASAEDILQTLGKARFEVSDGNIDQTEAGWIMQDRTKIGIMHQDVQDGIYPKVVMEMTEGQLLSKPLRETNQLPTDLDASGQATDDETEIYYCAWDQFHVGDTMDLQVNLFNSAAYPEGGNLQSTVARDEKLLQVVMKTDSALGNGQAASVVEAVDFGADAFS